MFMLGMVGFCFSVNASLESVLSLPVVERPAERGDVYVGSRSGGYMFSGKADFVKHIESDLRHLGYALNENEENVKLRPWFYCLSAISYARVLGNYYQIDGADILGEGKVAEIIARLAPILHLANQKYGANAKDNDPEPREIDAEDRATFESAKLYLQTLQALATRLLRGINPEAYSPSFCLHESNLE
jgi:hypothetical protein